VSANFISDVGMLKMIPRTGWISRKIGLQDVESVADHTYSASTLAMLLADMEASRGHPVDVEKVLRMALLHDLAEALTFDISKAYLEYLGPSGEAMKRHVEAAAWKYLIRGVGVKAMRMKYMQLQSEYNAQETVESQIVHAADKLDILFQIIAYHRKGYPRLLLLDLWRSTDHSLRRVRVRSVATLRRTAARLYKSAVST